MRAGFAKSPAKAASTAVTRALELSPGAAVPPRRAQGRCSGAGRSRKPKINPRAKAASAGRSGTDPERENQLTS